MQVGPPVPIPAPSDAPREYHRNAVTPRMHRRDSRGEAAANVCMSRLLTTIVKHEVATHCERGWTTP
eukprot:1025876-Pyramimonas_sp.AAC.1